MELEPRKSATRAGLAVYLFLSIAIVADPGREPLIDVALALPDPRCVCVWAPPDGRGPSRDEAVETERSDRAAEGDKARHAAR